MCQWPGEELIDREPAHGHHQRDGSRHTVGSPHPVIPFGAEIIAVDGLGGRGHPHKHGVGNLVHLHHHAINRKRHIPAIGVWAPYRVIKLFMVT